MSHEIAKKNFSIIFFRIFEQGFAMVIGRIDPWVPFESSRPDPVKKRSQKLEKSTF